MTGGGEEAESGVVDAIRILRDIGAAVVFPTESVYGNDGRTMLETRPCIVAEHAEHGEESMSGTLLNIAGVVVCVAYVAVIAGLFLGYLTLDAFELRIIQRGSLDEDERTYAEAILPVVNDRHRVLVTLLVLNGLGYEALPIFLDNLVPSWAAVLLSVSLILIFGEIIPSGIFTGPRQLYLGYRMVPLMQFFLWICYPIAHPMALLLDYLVEYDPDANGKGSHVPTNPLASADEEGYHRGELTALIRIQHEQDIKKQYGGVPNAAAAYSAKELPQHKQHRQASSLTSVQHRIKMSSHSKRLWMLSSLSSNPNWSDMKAEIMEKSRDIGGAPHDEHKSAGNSIRNLMRNSNNANANGSEDTDVVSPTLEQLAPPLHRTEVDVIEGALRMKTSLAMDVYTPLSKVHSIPDNLVLDKRAVTMIYSDGFSRMPVYDGASDDESRVYGFLMTRQLMLVNWSDRREVSTLPLQRPTCVSPRMNLVDLLHIVQTEGRLMTFVCARPDLANIALSKELPIPAEAGFMGIVTLEDIMESILQDRIYDEGDIKDRDRSVATLQRWAATKLQDFYRRQAAKRRGSNATMSSSSLRSISGEAQLPDDAGSNEAVPLLLSVPPGT